MILYYIVNSTDVATFTPYMESALPGEPFSVYYSKDGTQAIMKFDNTNLPPGYTDPGYDIDALKGVMDTATWGQNFQPRVLKPRVRNALAKTHGVAIIDDLFSQMDIAVGQGQLTIAQLDATLTQYKEFMDLLERGFFGLLLFKHSQNPIVGNGVLTQAQIDAILADITQWEADYPRN